MTHVTWYKTPDASARVAAYQWRPANYAGEPAPMDEGTLYFMDRESRGAVWSPPLTIASMPLVQARALAIGEGFTHEEGGR